MRRAKPIKYAVLTVLLVIGTVVPAGALAGPAGVATDEGARIAETNGAAGSRVNVTVGGQLSTVLSASSDEVRSAFGDTVFEVSVERGDEGEKAEAIAERADELEERAEEIREDYEAATDAYDEGEITASEYARRLATLNARANNLLGSVERVEEHAATVSALELRAAGLNRTALRAAVGDLDSVTGAGAAAVLTRFTGQSRGEIEIETADGLSIEVEGESGERSREIERRRDANDTMVVAQSDALATATAAISIQDGRWALRKASVHPDDGYYKFEFAFRTRNETGEAEVRVDGSSGEVFRLEEEIERREDDEDDREEDDERGEDEEDEDEEHEIALIVAEGTPGPGETVTVRALVDGAPVANVTVRLDGAVVGTTDANGTLAVTLPAGEAELRARRGEAEGELEFEFEEDEDETVFRHLNTTARLDDGTVTVTVTFNGSGVENATVYANGERRGNTGSDGTVAFTIGNGTDELELEIVKGEFEAEFEYRIRDGSLVLTEEPHEGDDEEGDDDERDNEERDGDEREDDDEEKDEESVDSLELSVIEGTPGPGETVTIEVRADGDPVSDVPVWLNDNRVGTTAEDGTIDVTFPEGEDEAEIEAEKGDAKGRLEFDFEDDEGDEGDES